MWEYLDKRMKGKANTNGLDKNKWNINKNGRPKRWIRLLNEKIKEKIWAVPTNSEIQDMVLWLLDLTNEELTEIVIDKDSSNIATIIAKELLADDKWFYAMNTLLDRWIWKSVQKVQAVNLNVEINPLEDRLKELWLS